MNMNELLKEFGEAVGSKSVTCFLLRKVKFWIWDFDKVENFSFYGAKGHCSLYVNDSKIAPTRAPDAWFGVGGGKCQQGHLPDFPSYHKLSTSLTVESEAVPNRAPVACYC